MKLDLVSPMVGANYRGFMTSFKSSVATKAKNNETRGTQWFRQVRASLQITTLHLVCVGV
jgi:hypothetical protein